MIRALVPLGIVIVIALAAVFTIVGSRRADERRTALRKVKVENVLLAGALAQIEAETNLWADVDSPLATSIRKILRETYTKRELNA